LDANCRFVAKDFDVSSRVVEKRLEKDGLTNDGKNK
jgi:hypothetical protein